MTQARRPGDERRIRYACHRSGRAGLASRMRGRVRWWMAGLLVLGVALGIAIAGTTVWMVNATSSDNFCATACHSMKWAAAAYERAPHYRNQFGVRASCADCHIPYESRPATPFQYVFGTLWTKGVDGTQDVYAKLLGEIADKAKWEARKPELTARVRAFFKETNSETCQGCHKLDAFKSTGPSAFMAMEVHQGLIKQDKVFCLECHSGIAHVYSAASR